jgi:hypothetical protein
MADRLRRAVVRGGFFAVAILRSTDIEERRSRRRFVHSRTNRFLPSDHKETT